MIVTTAQLYKVAYEKFAVGAYNRPPGKVFVQEYANFIAHKNEKLGSAGQLEAVRASVKK